MRGISIMNDLPSIENPVRSLLSVNMGLKESERLLVLGDTGGDDGALAREVGAVAQGLHSLAGTYIFTPVGGHGQEPPKDVWERAFGTDSVQLLEAEGLFAPLLSKEITENQLRAAGELLAGRSDKAVDVVVALTFFSTSHTSFRKLLTASCGARYASMPLFTRDMFFGAMDVDWTSLAASTNALGRALTGADLCEVSSPNGTGIVFRISGRPVLMDDGMLDKKGKFGNLPAGEVFIAPVEGTAEGTLVLEWGPRARFPNPLTVTVEEGKAVSVTGKDRESVLWLEEALKAHPQNTNVAELGIGTNPAAVRPDNVLESEKILGTIHIAFGDNHTFGGNVVAPYHQDFVVFQASLTAVWESAGGRRVLLDNGRSGW